MAKMEKETPQEFELIPSIGHLLPGQRANIQVKFMPLDEVAIKSPLCFLRPEGGGPRVKKCTFLRFTYVM